MLARQPSAPAPNTIHSSASAAAPDTALAAIDDASLAREAYRWLELLRKNELADEDLDRLCAVSQELDRRGVPCQDRW